MVDDNETSLQLRRKELQERLSAQRVLVAARVLAPQSTASAEVEAKDDGPPAANGLPVSPAYPRSMTLRLAERNPALAIGALALGLTLVLRGRGEQLNGILSMAKAVEPLFDP